MSDQTEHGQAVDQGIAAADGPEKAKEYADVARWQKAIKDGRDHDEEARKQYAKDRRAARGDSGFEVDTNLVGTYIDILENFLYSKDPDVDVTPARACQPPTLDALREAVEQTVNENPLIQQQLEKAAAAQAMQLASTAAQAASQVNIDPVAAAQVIQGEAMDKALAQLTEQYVVTTVERMRQTYAKRKRDAETYAETLEIIISRLWKDASLKPRGRRLVRSELTIGVGLFKASWQERTAPSPETAQAINDLQDNIKRAAKLRADMDEATGTELDEKTADYERQLEALKGQAEQVIARGFVVDSLPGENFQIPPGWAMVDHLDAPWNADRNPMLKADAQAHFGLTDEQIKQAKIYTARKPERVRSDSVAVVGELSANDADAFVEGSNGGAQGNGGEWVMPWEIWDRESNTVLTMIEGVKCWVKPAWQPTATTRFYPYFLHAASPVDGERHPQSLVSRSTKLVDEYNRIGSAEAEHRRRILPSLMFDATRVDDDTAKRLASPVVGAKIPVKPTKPGDDLRTLFCEINYPEMNPAVYDRQRIVAELERTWGIQEALSGSIQTQKTATEAEIQQSGFSARTSGRRDLLESLLADLAQYTAEVARANLSAEDVRGIAGPDAIWPEYTGAADLASMVTVDIRAGSSGKPNTSAERQAWASTLPLLSAAVDKIGALRGSLPSDIADSHEQLLRITAERAGDRINVDALLPKAGPAPMPTPGMPPGAAPSLPGAPAAVPASAPSLDPSQPAA